MQESWLIHVVGRVQGVYFRDFICKHARYLRIKGYVKNLNDGSIEIQAQGEIENLKLLIKFCQQGPPAANIESINIQKYFTNTYSSFIKKY